MWDKGVPPDQLVEWSEKLKIIHPDFKYMFWGIETMRDFIATKYSWFLPTFDAYPELI